MTTDPSHTAPTRDLRPSASPAVECRVLGTDQPEEWMAVLRRSAQHDFYHLPEYHRLAEKRGEGIAHLFAYSEGGHMLALPLLLRPVDESGDGGGWRDATSVYGYAGPLASHAEVPASVVKNFQAALKDELLKRRILAVFSRLHPLIPQPAVLAGLGDCRMEGKTVSIDLTLPPEEQWSRFRSSFRTRINKLQREGFACLRDGDKRHMREFTGIYHQTMHRVNAHEAYFFEPEYFSGLAGGLGSTLELFVVTLDGAVICGGLFTISDGIVQYHLGGTRNDFLKPAPMPLLIDTVRRWAIEEGARAFHLGGGVGSRDDSLFHFKAGFSDRRHTFPTWRWVLEPDVYRALCEQKAMHNAGQGVEWKSGDFFPQYRCPTMPAKRNADVGGGAGRHAKMLISTLIACGSPIAAACDENRTKWGTAIHGTRVSHMESVRGGKAIIHDCIAPVAVGIPAKELAR